MSDQHAAAVPAFGGSEVKKIGYSLYFKIPDNYLECRCSYIPREQGSMLTRTDMIVFLQQYSVCEGLDQEAFDDFVVKAAAGLQQVDILLASGTAPVAGADEYLSLLVGSSTTVYDSEKIKTDIDMHIVQTFINVTAGDEIARIIPAEPGIPGVNVMGVSIAPERGKPMKVTIGKNIRIEENGTLLLASATGRFCQSAGEISVEEEYIVKGDVNFRVGTINFKGVVEVRGDVLDNFDITASKGLTVSGNIGVCAIASDGDITFCGMDGQDKGIVICGGTLRANFIHDATVECAGDVIVGVEIHNCTIRALGRIVVDKGAISGGSCIALGGIEAKKFGSASSQLTKLHAGVDYHDVDLLEKKFVVLAEAQTKVKQSQSLSEITELRQTIATLSDSIMSIRSKSYAAANAKINAKAVLFENVQLTVGTVTETVKEQLNGSHTIIENSIDGGLRFLPLTSLDVKAVDMERACVREQKKSLKAG